MRPLTETVSVTTDGAGTATVYSSNTIRGRVAQIEYIKDDYLDTVAFLITGETSGVVLWFQSNVTTSTTHRPTQPANTQTGGTVTGGYRDIWLVGERIKFFIVSGGTTKSGSFRITWDRPDE